MNEAIRFDSGMHAPHNPVSLLLLNVIEAGAVEEDSFVTADMQVKSCTVYTVRLIKIKMSP